MNSTASVLLTIVGGVALLMLALIGGMAVYDAVADDDTMGGMWDRMDDMGGMMGDGMMGGRSGGNETSATASGQGQVRIADFNYEPSMLQVTPGTVVKWTNEDSAPTRRPRTTARSIPAAWTKANPATSRSVPQDRSNTSAPIIPT